MNTHNTIHDPSCAIIRDRREELDYEAAPPCTCGAREKRPRPTERGYIGGESLNGHTSLGDGNYWHRPARVGYA